MNLIVAVNTLAYYGYDIETTLKNISQLGTKYVELVYIKNYYKELTENFFNSKNASRVKKLLSDYGLSSVALAAHMDLGFEDSVDKFKRRMEFGKELGVKIINTNATGKENEKLFLNNIEKLIIFAEKLDVTIGLENPGDGSNNILGTGKEGVALIKMISSERVRLNYDFANAYMYSKGVTVPENEFMDALPYTVHFHLKDTIKKKDGYYLTKIGSGNINYTDIFRKLREIKMLIPMSIELPLRFKWDLDYRFISNRLAKPLPLQKINDIVKASLVFVENELDG